MSSMLGYDDIWSGMFPEGRIHSNWYRRAYRWTRTDGRYYVGSNYVLIVNQWKESIKT